MILGGNEKQIKVICNFSYFSVIKKRKLFFFNFSNKPTFNVHLDEESANATPHKHAPGQSKVLATR